MYSLLACCGFSTTSVVLCGIGFACGIIFVLTSVIRNRNS